MSHILHHLYHVSDQQMKTNTKIRLVMTVKTMAWAQKQRLVIHTQYTEM